MAQPIPSTDVMICRIRAAWDDATADDLATGLDWYRRARETAETLSAGTPFTVEQTAAVIAALSPRNGWLENVAGASDMVNAASWHREQPTVAGLPINRDKAWRILQSSTDPEAILGGNKVCSFYRNIMGDEDAVTIDVWGLRLLGLDNRSLTRRQYERIADAYRQVAVSVGHSPRDVQAATWTYYRRHFMSTFAPRQTWLLKEHDFS